MLFSVWTPAESDVVQPILDRCSTTVRTLLSPQAIVAEDLTEPTASVFAEMDNSYRPNLETLLREIGIPCVKECGALDVAMLTSSGVEPTVAVPPGTCLVSSIEQSACAKTASSPCSCLMASLLSSNLASCVASRK